MPVDRDPEDLPPEALPHGLPEALPHRGFLSLEPPSGAYAAMLTKAQHRRVRRAQLTAGLAGLVAVAAVGGALTVSGLGNGKEQALLPAARAQLAASPVVPEQDSSVPTPAAPTVAAAAPLTSPPVASAPATTGPGSPGGTATASPTEAQVPITALLPVSPTTVQSPLTACATVVGRALDTTGAPLTDLFVSRFEQAEDGTVAVSFAARTDVDGRFSVAPGGSLMLSPSAPGTAQTQTTRNLVPAWVGAGAFPANPAGCDSPDTVLVPGATMVGGYATPPAGTDVARDALMFSTPAPGSPLAVAPSVAALDEQGFRLVGLPVTTGAVLRDRFEHERTVDVTAGSSREDWFSCTTCLSGRPTRGGAAQVDPSAPPVPTDPPRPSDPPAPSDAPTPTPTAPSPTPTADLPEPSLSSPTGPVPTILSSLRR